MLALAISDRSVLTERLIKLLGMIGSDHDGEALNAARLADKLLRDAGMTWADVIVKPTVSVDIVVGAIAEIRLSGIVLNTKEWHFLADLPGFTKFSDGQLAWLDRMLSRARAFAAAPPPPPPPPPPKPRKTRAPGKRNPKPVAD